MRRLLIVGYGDIARRARRRLPSGTEVALISRRHGADLDRPETLTASMGQGDSVLYTAPPPAAGEGDPRASNLLAAFDRGRIIPARMVYLSTSGVYGDCGGDWVDETRPVNPQSFRANRRVAAEDGLRSWCAEKRVPLIVLRVPGIYAADRLPLEPVRAGAPVFRDEDDVYTNHVHADDLASICLRALEDSAPTGIYNASDDSVLKMGEWFDLLADRFGLTRPPRLPRAEAGKLISPMRLSFMLESRRLVNLKLKRELGVTLAYPTVFDGVPQQSAALA